MAVEELHFAPYMVESSASNPELAVFFRHHAPYVLEAPAVNAAQSVFINSINDYVLFGRDIPSAASLRYTVVYEVLSASPISARPQVIDTRMYQVFGGKRNLTPRLKVPTVTVYEIFT